MLRKITAYFFACLFLLGSAILPLSDFSLVNDIPRMYHAYEKLAAPDEAGIADFIGDYLLGGKALFGHNKNDKPENSDASVQFQHSPSSFNYLFCSLQIPFLFFSHFKNNRSPVEDMMATTAFHAELLRPPLI